MRRKTIAIGAAISVVTAGIAGQPGHSEASVTGWSWAATSSTLSQGSLSNQVGFWQTLLCSNDELLVDGSFGPVTKSRTKAFQQDILHFTGGYVDGVVGWQTWQAAQNALAPGYTFPALQDLTLGNWSYYAGGNSMQLYFDYQSSSIWKFKYNPGPASNHIPGTGTQSIQATNSRTITGGACVMA